MVGSSALTLASRSWPHGTTTNLSLILVVPVGAPVVLVLVALEVLAAVTVVVPVVSVVPVVVSAVEIAVFVRTHEPGSWCCRSARGRARSGRARGGFRHIRCARGSGIRACPEGVTVVI